MNTVNLFDLSGRVPQPMGWSGQNARTAGAFGSQLSAARNTQGQQTDVITLYLPGEGCLYSGGRMGARGMQDVYVEYAEGSTEEDPIVRISGKSDRGSFDFTRHIRDIDPTNASYAEMSALFGYLVHTGAYKGSGGQVVPYGFEYHGSLDISQKQDFISAIASVSTSSHVGPRGKEDARYLLGLYRDYMSQSDTHDEKPATRTKLSDQDIGALAGKYDTSNMTQDQYDAFLDELVEKGVLSRSDTMRLGRGGLQWLDIDPEDFATGKAGWAYIENDNYLKRTLEDAEGDLMVWLESMLARLEQGVDPSTEEGKRQRTQALSTLQDIVRRMNSARV